MAQPLLHLQEISKYYVNGQNVTTGLTKVSLKLFRGEFVAITGESGSGKSTLAHILGGILSYEDGELLFDGAPTSHFDSADWEHYRRDNIAFISQNYGILPGATVEDNVISALRLSGMSKHRCRTKARGILRKVELWEMRGRRAAKLSSGQKQRLAIARALAKPCPILIADEPTGNLDPENSEKVIKLLSQAAADRLVILITHEFHEAADYATRHIALQDGRISMDAQLNGAVNPAQEDTIPGTAAAAVSGIENRQTRVGAGSTYQTTDSTHRPTKPDAPKLASYTAGLQLRSRPVWCTIVLLFFALTAFAVFAFLGTFIVALDDTPTRIYETDAFLNGAKDRIVAVRKDAEPMTDEDYEAILSLKYVEQLERYGYIADSCYAYRQDMDYELHYGMHNYGSATDPLYIEMETVTFKLSEQYIQTVPLLSADSDFLTGGRLPENFCEVVAVGDSRLIGDELTVYLWDLRRWGSSDYIKLDVAIVGVTDSGSGLYFHEDVGKVMTLNYLGVQDTLIPIYEDIPSDVAVTEYRDAASKALYGSNAAPFMVVCEPAEDSIMRLIADNEVLISSDTYVRQLSSMGTVYNGDGNVITDSMEIIRRTWHSSTVQGVNIMGLHDSTLDSVIGVSPDFFRDFMDKCRYQHHRSGQPENHRLFLH